MISRQDIIGQNSAQQQWTEPFIKKDSAHVVTIEVSKPKARKSQESHQTKTTDKVPMDDFHNLQMIARSPNMPSSAVTRSYPNCWNPA